MLVLYIDNILFLKENIPFSVLNNLLEVNPYLRDIATLCKHSGKNAH